jgi:hypothetical protein
MSIFSIRRAQDIVAQMGSRGVFGHVAVFVAWERRGIPVISARRAPRWHSKMVLTQRTDTLIHLTRSQLDQALGALCVLGLIDKGELNSGEF